MVDDVDEIWCIDTDGLDLEAGNNTQPCSYPCAAAPNEHFINGNEEASVRNNKHQNEYVNVNAEDQIIAQENSSLPNSTHESNNRVKLLDEMQEITTSKQMPNDKSWRKKKWIWVIT